MLLDLSEQTIEGVILVNKIQKVFIDTLIIRNQINSSLLFDECDEIEIIKLVISDSTVNQPIFLFNSIKSRIKITNVSIQNIKNYSPLFVFSNSTASILLNDFAI